MNYYNPNRSPSGPQQQPNNSAGCLIIVAILVFFSIIIFASVTDGSAIFLPIAILVLIVGITMAVARAAKNQSPQRGAPQQYGRPPYSPPAQYPGSPISQPRPNRTPQSSYSQANYDSHLCDEAVHTAESPAEQRVALNQLQPGYGTQVARKDRRQPSRAYDINNHNEGLKALVDAGLMTREEYESMSRR